MSAGSVMEVGDYEESD